MALKSAFKSFPFRHIRSFLLKPFSICGEEERILGRPVKVRVTKRQKCHILTSVWISFDLVGEREGEVEERPGEGREG